MGELRVDCILIQPSTVRSIQNRRVRKLSIFHPSAHVRSMFHTHEAAAFMENKLSKRRRSESNVGVCTVSDAANDVKEPRIIEKR